ncbi:hypothetical protein RUM43_000348 [Polyplax serrata]|uniref:PAP-associated domain-containing protein n=1 Tax=Polyplax serrata TaxID=468196 RepID=A0AAN8SCA0_POLSC
MNSPHVSQQESKSHLKEETAIKKNAKHICPINAYAYFDYSYLFEFDLLRLMGVEMPPIHKTGYQPTRGSYWRERHPNGVVLTPPPMVLPFYHSPNMISNTQMKRTYWNHSDHQRDDRINRDSMVDGSNNSDSGFSSPVPCKHQPENIVLDDSSEDSFHSSASENGRSINHHHHHHHEFPSYPHHQSHTAQGYGKRRHNSGHRSPLEYTPQTIYRSHGQYHNNQCRTTQSHNDLSSTHGNNRQYGRRMFITGSQSYSSCIPPDKFLARAHLMQVTKAPGELNMGGEWEKLSIHIFNRFLSHQQTSDTFKKKITLWKNLFLFIRTNFPKYGLFLVGSTMSGFGSNDSDVDMCLLVRHAEMDQRNEAVSHLGHVSRYLRHCDFIDHVELIQAKVPILKFRSVGFEVDLNCNNAVGIRNTHLLYCYSQMDWRVRPLVLIVKLWAARHNINDAKKMTISSGVSPAVLPCLHELYKEKFNPLSDINQIDMHEELRPYNSLNKLTLGELLVGFLYYFANFNYSMYAVSVRLGSKVYIDVCRRAKSFKNDPHQWKYLCIEEPFDLTNTARAVYDAVTFQRIKNVFKESHKNLEKTRCLDSIFEQGF